MRVSAGSLGLAGVVGVGGLVLVSGLYRASTPDYRVLGTIDLAGPLKAYKNPLLSPYISQGTGYADVVEVDGIRYVSDAPIVGQPVGVMLNANHYAACVGMTVPVMVGIMAAGAMRLEAYRSLFWGATLLVIAAGFWAVAVRAESRGATIALAAAGSCLAMWGCHLRLRGPVKLLSIGAIGLAAMAAIGIAASAGVFDDLVRRMDGTVVAWEMFTASPWLGVGWGHYGDAYPAFREELVSYFAHNVYAEYLAETGIAGLVLAAGAAVWIGRVLWRGRHAARTQQHGAVRIGVVGGLLFAAIHATVDYSVQVPVNAIILLVLLTWLVAESWARGGKSVDHNELQGNHGKLPYRRAALAIVVLGACGWGIVHLAGDLHAHRRMMPLRRAIVLQQLPETELSAADKELMLRVALPDGLRAARIRPRQADYARYLGQAYLHLSLVDGQRGLMQSRRWFARAAELSTWNPWAAETLTEIDRRVAVRG